jgi:hypothetical protein
MTELKHKIIDYWMEQYHARRWPFVGRIQMANSLGESLENTNTALKELWREKKVIFRRGVNDTLVIYVGDKKIMDEIKNLLNKKLWGISSKTS